MASNQLLRLAFWSSIGLCACAPEWSVRADTAGAPAVSLEDSEAAARLQSDAAWLADDARQGRRAGTDEARASAQWLAARFQSLGLAPAGDGGFLQAFPVPLPA